MTKLNYCNIIYLSLVAFGIQFMHSVNKLLNVDEQIIKNLCSLVEARLNEFENIYISMKHLCSTEQTRGTARVDILNRAISDYSDSSDLIQIKDSTSNFIFRVNGHEFRTLIHSLHANPQTKLSKVAKYNKNLPLPFAEFENQAEIISWLIEVDDFHFEDTVNFSIFIRGYNLETLAIVAEYKYVRDEMISIPEIITPYASSQPVVLIDNPVISLKNSN